MKYQINSEQHFFFEQHHYIEFSQMLSAAEQHRLQEALKNVDIDRRDLSRTSKPLQKIAYKAPFAKLAAELTHKRLLRFGFDQLLCPPFSLANLHNEVCINGLACALYLELDSEEAKAIYALPTVDLSHLPLDQNRRYFLICFAEERAQYVLRPQDKFTHELKRVGYVFGDRLE